MDPGTGLAILGTAFSSAKTLEKLLGPTADYLGEGLREWAEQRVQNVGRIFRKAADRLGEEIECPGGVPPRVLKDILDDGSYCDDEVCAEYFGGILASSRSEDGKDDSGIQFLDVIKSLSSRQLCLHYLIYNCLNKILVVRKQGVNVAQGSEIQSRSVWLSGIELQSQYSINADTDFNILFRQGLICQYKMDLVRDGDTLVVYAMAKPTTFGVMLYASAHNRMNEWRGFTSVDFGNFENIAPPGAFADSLDELKKLCSFRIEEATNADSP